MTRRFVSSGMKPVTPINANHFAAAQEIFDRSALLK
jgi:hypothetical protein